MYANKNKQKRLLIAIYKRQLGTTIKIQQSIMRINNTEIRSKSLHRKPVINVYLPAVDLKHKANFILKNNLRSNDNNKPQQSKRNIIQKLNLSYNNPQNSMLLPSPRTKKATQKRSSLVKNNKKMTHHHQDLSNNAQKQSQWKNRSAVYFTKRQMSLFEQRFIEIQQKKKILDQKMLTRKDSFESFKRMKQFLREEEKQDLLGDLFFKKYEDEREKQILSIRKLQEKNLLHEENLAKISMERELKFQKKQEQLSLTKRKLLQTENHSEHLKFEEIKAKKIHKNFLKTRLEFLKNRKVGFMEKGGYLTERSTSRKFNNGRNEQFQNVQKIDC